MTTALAGLVKSKRFWLAVFGVVEVLVAQYFQIEPKVWQSLTSLIMLLIAAYTIEDTVGAYKSGEKS